jgi:ubiquinone/menaquinone biosynthesis C-methylase UbiE
MTLLREIRERVKAWDSHFRERLNMSDKSSYVLGHGDPGMERLQLQAKLIEGVSRRLIRECGIGPGMRVLDVGCGVGDMSMLLAEAVGSSGHVVAFDREQRPVDVARERAHKAGLAQIEFVVTSDDALPDRPPFDAVVGRYILMHQPDPTAMLRRVASAARPGGVIAFHEIALRVAAYSSPQVVLFARIGASIETAFRALLPQYDVGERLVGCFGSAGLAEPQLICESIAGTSTSSMLPWLVMTYQTLLPHIERLGLLDKDIGDPRTLLRRLTDEAAAAGAQLVSKPQVCAWPCWHKRAGWQRNGRDAGL